MLDVWDYVEASVVVEVPGFLGDGFILVYDAVSNGEKGGGVVVEWSFELFPSRLLWGQCVLVEEIEGELGLVEELVPEVVGKVGVDAGKDGE